MSQSLLPRPPGSTLFPSTTLFRSEPPEELQQSEPDPQRMREALFSAARAAVEAIARRRPLVLAIDDIHWADEGMLEDRKSKRLNSSYPSIPHAVFCLRKERHQSTK